MKRPIFNEDRNRKTRSALHSPSLWLWVSLLILCQVQVWAATFYVDFAANGNNKTLKAYFGATQLFTTGAVAFNAGDWTMQIEIIRISNTSQISNVTFQSSNASLTSSAAVTTSAETLSGAVTFKCTGEATATDDITQKTELVYYGKGQ